MIASAYIVGLTGGIGSGKSTVAELFADRGVALIDTDALAHALTAVDGIAIDAIRTEMGAAFIANDGALDRVAARTSVFADANLKRKLEAILHPLIHTEVENALRSVAVQKAPYVMLIVPLLFETQTYRERIHTTLLVDCPVATQLARVQRRSGLPADEIERIVRAQLPRALRLQLAHDLISNGKMVETLSEQVDPIHQRYLQNATTLK